MIRSVEIDTESEPEEGALPSLTIVRRQERSLWELAKLYHSTVALVECANPDEAKCDDLLLIPRAR